MPKYAQAVKGVEIMCLVVLLLPAHCLFVPTNSFEDFFSSSSKRSPIGSRVDRSSSSLNTRPIVVGVGKGDLRQQHEEREENLETRRYHVMAVFMQLMGKSRSLTEND